MSGSRQRDRREHKRISVDYEIELRPINPPAGGPGVDVRYGSARNVSKGGVAVSVDYPYPVEPGLLVSFRRKDGGLNCIMSRTGTVAWLNPLPSEGRCLLGIKFTDDGDE